MPDDEIISHGDQIYRSRDRNIQLGDAAQWAVREFTDGIAWRISQKGNPYVKRGHATFVVIPVDNGANVSFTVPDDTRWHKAYVYFPEKIGRLMASVEDGKRAVESLDLTEIADAVNIIRDRSEIALNAPRVSETQRPPRTPVPKTETLPEPGQRKIRLD